MLARNALTVGAVALTVTGCALQHPLGYAPALPEYQPSPRIVVIPRQPYPPPVMAQTYRPQPAAVEQPTSADRPPLRAVEPVGQYRFDNSCVGAWRICHFF
jgi:hypothetical protein